MKEKLNFLYYILALLTALSVFFIKNLFIKFKRLAKFS
ncbi:hypothetical protein E34_0795 [Lactococcus lactis subsp. lactis]|uniref:Uncharacterized protein n=2 Tax=Lactococcus lactis TaxID=1358 RepID=A0A0V8B4E9_LACLL|nr:hypothetical protein Llab_0827 [Lactococcus lactis]KST79289.1 hypothetical protein E34_0795 [Lactococcus lactis subsp. lactis]PCS13016.1 hypothetical protein RU90_GL002431 [Lactococcus lactis subsp. hordniae]CDI46928.1 hypothetical protein BN927_00589 [Lactococcus lactis subsp. lactis Dephy 1]KST83965.1 hypothetical protein LK337_1088 [Lactococcus lactis subsp. lactis]